MPTFTPVDHDPFADSPPATPDGIAVANNPLPAPAPRPASPVATIPPPAHKPDVWGDMVNNMPIWQMVMPEMAKGFMEMPQYKAALQQSQIDQRRKQAEQLGIDPVSPEGKQYLLTGSIPKFDADRVAIRKADEQRTDLDNAIDTAHHAIDLNPKAYVGLAPETRATLGGWIGLDSAANTQEYQANAKLLSQMLAKANSGGRVNQFEQKLMSDLQGGLNQSVQARAAILNTALDHLMKKKAMADQQAYELRTGAYYKPQAVNGAQPRPVPGASPAPPQAASPAAAPNLSHLSNDDLLKALGQP